MATMFEVKNTGNSVQIDDDYNNLTMYGKTDYKIGMYPYDTRPSLRAYSSVDDKPFAVAIAGDHSQNFNNPTLALMVGVVFPPKESQNNLYSVTAYNFEKNMPDSNYGLSVYGPTGQLLYNSNAKPLRVLDRITGTISKEQQFNEISLFKKTYPGKKVAVVFGQPPLGAIMTPIESDRSTTSLWTSIAINSNNGSTIEVRYSYSFRGEPYWGGGGGYWENHMQNDYDLLIVDVTGY
jgi:hypothetical protein